MKKAIQYGGKKLDHFDGFLTGFYKKLNFKKTDYFYYLHDSSGKIHYGKTLEEHNTNKNSYLL